LHGPLNVPFLGNFWHAIRTHVYVQCKKIQFFYFICYFFIFLLEQEHISSGAEKPCEKSFLYKSAGRVDISADPRTLLLPRVHPKLLISRKISAFVSF
jgi:hypothetical protein